MPTNLSGIGGPEDGWVHDCRVQSINITSGELLFEWSALEHVPVVETFYTMDEVARGTGWSKEYRESFPTRRRRSARPNSTLSPQLSISM